MDLSPQIIRDVVDVALREDIGSGDLTTLAVIPAEAETTAHFAMREPGVICGLPVIRAVFAAIDPSIRVTLLVAEGKEVERGTVVASVRGSARGILSGERVALNLVQR